MKHIILLGHRAQVGKNLCGDLIEEILSEEGIWSGQIFFAETLKRQVAERYNLDAAKMEFDHYKKWCPPWIKPRTVEVDVDVGGDGSRIEKQIREQPRTVRQILIEEGAKGRDLWEDVWANSAYQKLLGTGHEIGIITDFRFPNEYECFENSFKAFTDSKAINPDMEMPKLHKVLVYRPAQEKKNDGVDDILPDLEGKDYWDFVIMNDVEDGLYIKNLKKQLKKLLKKIGVL